jgi:hypothetical protein
MFVRSTGLGRTLLTGRIGRVMATTIVPASLEEASNGTREQMRILMEMEILQPVNWTVRAFLDPHDLRELIKKIITNPVLMLNGIRFLFMKRRTYDVSTAHKEAQKAAGPGLSASPKEATAGTGTAPKGPPPIPSCV